MQHQHSLYNLLDCFLQLDLDVESISNHKEHLVLPVLSEYQLIYLFQRAQNVLRQESQLLTISSPVVVIGDLHGHFMDLLRIIQNNGKPDQTKYMFLGDLIDRGEFSIETFITILLMKICYPTNVFIIRGNHEFDSMCSCGGFNQFKEQFMSLYYNNDLYQMALNVMNEISLAAIIDGQYFCVHGGIGPSLVNAKEIYNIAKPINDFTHNDIVTSLVWNDPKEIQGFEKSIRGVGFKYGQDVVDNFLNTNSFSMIIRAHERVENGYKSHFNGKVVTAFSASNYCGRHNNSSAILLISPENGVEVKYFEPMRFLFRAMVQFSAHQPTVPQSELYIARFINISSSVQKAPFSKMSAPRALTPPLPQTQRKSDGVLTDRLKYNHAKLKEIMIFRANLYKK